MYKGPVWPQACNSRHHKITVSSLLVGMNKQYGLRWSAEYTIASKPKERDTPPGRPAKSRKKGLTPLFFEHVSIRRVIILRSTIL